MSDLREAREKAGLTIAEASQRTRIPERYLEALEKGDHGVFPPGPFLSGYTRQYRAFLQLPERPVVVPASGPAGRRGSVPPSRGGAARAPSSRAPVPRGPDGGGEERTVTEPAAPSRRARQRVLRAVAAGGLASFALLLVVAIAGEVFPGDEADALAAPDQRVAVTVEERVRARVEADGRSVLDGALVPGAARVFEAHDRLVLDLQSLQGVNIVYNGRPLTPLGARGLRRRLVFIDDAGE